MYAGVLGIYADMLYRPCTAHVYLFIYYHKNSSGDEIANVNFYAVRPEAVPEFAEITQNNAIMPSKVIQGHQFWYQSKAHIRFPINTNLPPTLHRFRDMAVDRSEIAITPLVFNSPGGGGTISVKFSVDVSGWPRYLMP